MVVISALLVRLPKQMKIHKNCLSLSLEWRNCSACIIQKEKKIIRNKPERIVKSSGKMSSAGRREWRRRPACEASADDPPSTLITSRWLDAGAEHGMQSPCGCAGELSLWLAFLILTVTQKKTRDTWASSTTSCSRYLGPDGRH